MNKFFQEESSSIPVYAECDVLVVGGGAAGHSAAVAAARAGCKNIILMERYGYFGGDVTGGYVIMLPNLSWYDKSFIRGLKILRIDVENQDFDFFSCVNRIDQYCAENMLSSLTKYRLHLAFEEMLQVILRPILEKTSVHVTIEHSDKDKSTDMVITYNGHYFDPADCEDELSYKMLCWAVGKIIHTYDESTRLNTLRFDEPTNPSDVQIENK